MSDQIQDFRTAYAQGFKDGFRAAQELVPAEPPKPGAAQANETELPDLGEGMPSDADMLLYATPFFETETEKKEAAAKDDAAEDEK